MNRNLMQNSRRQFAANTLMSTALTVIGPIVNAAPTPTSQRRISYQSPVPARYRWPIMRRSSSINEWSRCCFNFSEEIMAGYTRDLKVFWESPRKNRVSEFQDCSGQQSAKIKLQFGNYLITQLSSNRGPVAVIFL